MEDLTLFPSGGNRRTLDARWLASLERQGLAAFLPSQPAVAPQRLLRAAEQFNGGQFWECHETLEDLWRETPYPLRLFYHSIIKVAVGFHHLERHNRHGASAKLAEGVQLMGAFTPVFMRIATGSLLEDASRWLGRLEAGSRLCWPDLDALPRPQIRAASPGDPTEAD
jgi:hypothetical protein